MWKIAMVAFQLSLQAVPPGPFPLLQDKPGQSHDLKATTFRVPHELGYLEKFYREQFKGEAQVTFLKKETDKGTELTITSKRPGEGWVKAVLLDEGVTTRITVFPLVVMSAESVNGKERP